MCSGSKHSDKTSEVVAPTTSITETATQPASTATPIPTATITPSPTPDLSLVGLPTEEDGTLVFDFVEQMCEAQWSNRGLELPCPGNDTQSSAGYVMKLDGEAQGTSIKYEYPAGIYPAGEVRDHFQQVSRLHCAKRETVSALCLPARSTHFVMWNLYWIFPTKKGAPG